jgi:NTP pyrophosphatase (non-canonical NTP hydrolase)
MTPELLKIIRQSNKKEEKNIQLKTIKLMEETGELAADILKYFKFKTNSNYPNKPFSKDNLVEEFADVFIVLMSLYFHITSEKDMNEYDLKSLEKAIYKKYEKWKMKIEFNISKKESKKPKK